MHKKLLAGMAALAIAASSVLVVSPAQARWHGHWHHGGWGAPLAGFAAGAIIGGALASAPPPAYYYGPGPYYYGPGYGGPDVAWCEQHYRSYDPASGTYLGYDGLRHPCP